MATLLRTIFYFQLIWLKYFVLFISDSFSKSLLPYFSIIWFHDSRCALINTERLSLFRDLDRCLIFFTLGMNVLSLDWLVKFVGPFGKMSIFAVVIFVYSIITPTTCYYQPKEKYDIFMPNVTPSRVSFVTLTALYVNFRTNFRVPFLFLAKLIPMYSSKDRPAKIILYWWGIGYTVLKNDLILWIK